MARLTVIVGLAGSGKSHLTNEIAAEKGIPAFHDFLARNLIPYVTLSEGFCSLLIALHAGKDCVANEVCLVHADKWAAFIKLMDMIFEKTVTINPIFFENTPAQCVANVDADNVKPNKKGRLEGIAYYTQAYSIPDGAETRPVYVPAP